jgi:hypothetical protein
MTGFPSKKLIISAVNVAITVRNEMYLKTLNRNTSEANGYKR